MRRNISSRQNSAATSAAADMIEVPEFIFADQLRAMAGWDADDAKIIYSSKHARGKGINWALWLTLAGSLLFFATSLAGLFALAGFLIRAIS
ncbi:hypothetical protein [Martelella sp. AD-3]|uniref:hypothetical protein n=1 Tax=Martelella sp. AD-3 TaxID=686597 RepID=UPI000AFF66D6|nr:hypothetical protein [Martelella sp. AD-3]MAM11423.1 hypothetical protein [Rhizobiaceae bacterium]